MNARSVSGRVVVTGVSSFLGAHLATGFSRAGFQVTGTISLPESAYDDMRTRRLDAVRASGGTLATLDLNDPETIQHLVTSIEPDIWVHHAGWATDYASAGYDLARGFEVNVLGLGRVYEHLAHSRCRGVIVTGSSAEYSNSERANRESDPCFPATPYGLAKLAETLRAQQLACQYGIRTRVARVYIPFGPLDAPQKLLSSVIRSLKRGDPVDLSPCTQRRDFIHVDDLVAGYLALAHDCTRKELFDIFNLSSGRAVELRSFIQSVCGIMGADPGLLHFGAIPMRAGEPLTSYGDASKARDVLGWAATDPIQAVRAYLVAIGALARQT
jgi:nucleoside-diphosphate-sugar epimerase